MYEDAKKINPMELWDLHHVRRIDDGGFISDLYGRRNARTAKDRKGPEYVANRSRSAKLSWRQ